MVHLYSLLQANRPFIKVTAFDAVFAWIEFAQQINPYPYSRLY